MANSPILSTRFSLAAAACAVLIASCATAPSPLFLSADANIDGVVDKSELDDYLANRMMKAYDTNGDKGISFDEWHRVNPEATKAKFAKRDTNKDGKIDMAEQLVVVNANPTFGRLMESIDKNGDGVAQPKELEAFQSHMDEI